MSFTNPATTLRSCICPNCETRNDMVHSVWGDYIIWTCTACKTEMLASGTQDIQSDLLDELATYEAQKEELAILQDLKDKLDDLEAEIVNIIDLSERQGADMAEVTKELYRIYRSI